MAEGVSMVVGVVVNGVVVVVVGEVVVIGLSEAGVELLEVMLGLAEVDEVVDVDGTTVVVVTPAAPLMITTLPRHPHSSDSADSTSLKSKEHSLLF